MSKGLKLFLMISGIVVGAGIILGIIGLAFGGIKGLSGVESKIPWVSLGGSGEIEMQEKSIGAFTSVDLDCDMGDVEFIKGDQYAIEASYDKKLGAPEVKVENNTLKIKSASVRHRWFNFNLLSLSTAKESSIKIYYPGNAAFSSIKLKNDMGEVTINGVKANSMDLNVNAGNVTLDNAAVDRLKMNVDMGNIEGSNITSGNTDIKVNAGSAAVSGNFAGTTEINCDMGDCTLTTGLAKETYSINAKVDLGECNVDGQSVGGTYNTVNNSAANRLNIECDMGNIDVNFQ